MKRIMAYILIIAAILSLYGCSKISQETDDFIPTPAVTPAQSGEVTAAVTPAQSGEVTPAVTPALSGEVQGGQAVEDTTDKNAAENTTDKKVPETQAEAEPSEEPVYTGKTTTKYVKLNTYSGTLYIRSTPSKDGEIVGFLVHTEKIEVISIENGWASFLYQDKVCYVNSEFLADKKPKYIDPPTPTPAPTLTPTPTPDPNAVKPEI